MVGNALVQHCHSQHITVNYLTTNKEKIINREGYNGFYWDPDTQEIDTACFEGVSAVINLAGASIAKRWTGPYKQKILSSRINSLKTLRRGLESIDHTKITSFVSASAIGIYPNSPSAYYTEAESEVDNSFLGEVVASWEKEVDNFQKLGLMVAKIRIGLVLASEGGALPKIAGPIRKYVGAAVGSGEQWQSWIHVNDLARIFLFVIENRLQGIFNGVASNPVTNAKLTKEIAGVLKKPLFLPNVPEFVMKILLGEMSYLLFASQRVSSKKIEEEGFDFNYPNIKVALHNIYASNDEQQSRDTQLNKEFG